MLGRVASLAGGAGFRILQCSQRLGGALLARPAPPALLARPPPRRDVVSTTPVAGRRSSKIAFKKGKTDAAKAKLFGKFGKQIAQAVRAGGADASANARLRDVLAAARAANVPTDIIERNLKAGDKSGADFADVVYEAYGPAGGTGFVIECLTDNVNRSAADVRAAVVKAGGKMADSGSVLFNFRRAGRVLVRDAAGAGEDAVFEAALEAGATDVAPADDDGGGFCVTTEAEDYGAVVAGLRAAGMEPDAEASGLVYVALAPAELDDAAFEANEAMLERVLSVDDVDAVFCTAEGLV